MGRSIKNNTDFENNDFKLLSFKVVCLDKKL